MFGDLPKFPPDKIIGLMQAFRDDPRDDKIDLGVGIWRDKAGQTPVMRAVKTAEAKILDHQTTKSYTALEGSVSFRTALTDLVMGNAFAPSRIASSGTPGGTAALHQALTLLRMSRGDMRVWVPNPTWPNHLTMLAQLGLRAKPYRYVRPDARTVDFEAMMQDLSTAVAGDVILLHGCCHNPTGADLGTVEWSLLSKRMAERGLTPLIDLAYQGFGDGLEADVAGARHLAAALPETLIAVSCSKTFGLYRDRAGMVLAIAPTEPLRDRAQEALVHLNRQTFGFPPDHGARIVTAVLTEKALRTDWVAELGEMRDRLVGLRAALRVALSDRAEADRFGFLTEHRGLFSITGLSPEQVDELRLKHGIYLIGDGRMNLSGLNKPQLPRVADALVAVGL